MNNKIIIATDLGLLRAYRLERTPRGTPHLDFVDEFILEEAHERFAELVTDRAGRRASPSQKSRAAPVGDAHNLELETRRRLIKQIAGHIEQLMNRDSEAECWLAAEKEIIHQIFEELPQNFRSRIVKNIARDLVKVSQKELVEQFINALP